MSDWVFHSQCMRVGSPGCRDLPPQRFWFRFFHNYFTDYYLFILLFLLCNEEKCPLLLPVLITICSSSKTQVWSLGTLYQLQVTYAFQQYSNERHFGENLDTKPKMPNCFCSGSSSKVIGLSKSSLGTMHVLLGVRFGVVGLYLLANIRSQRV